MARAHAARLALPTCKRADRQTLIEHPFMVSAPIVLLSYISSSYCILSDPLVSLAIPRVLPALFETFRTCKLLQRRTSLSFQHLYKWNRITGVGRVDGEGLLQ